MPGIRRACAAAHGAHRPGGPQDGSAAKARLASSLRGCGILPHASLSPSVSASCWAAYTPPTRVMGAGWGAAAQGAAGQAFSVYAAAHTAACTKSGILGPGPGYRRAHLTRLRRRAHRGGGRRRSPAGPRLRPAPPGRGGLRLPPSGSSLVSVGRRPSSDGPAVGAGGSPARWPVLRPGLVPARCRPRPPQRAPPLASCRLYSIFVLLPRVNPRQQKAGQTPP